jgi:hypothetical protein
MTNRRSRINRFHYRALDAVSALERWNGSVSEGLFKEHAGKTPSFSRERAQKSNARCLCFD